jgi:GNAT superfamily N-acetyltransferase
MATDAPFASTEFVAVHADGSRGPVHVSVGVPTRRDTGEWRCRVRLDGLEPSLPDIAGEDALQSLGLAFQLLGQLLARFEATGGRLEFPGGGRVPLAAYFGASGARRDAG